MLEQFKINQSLNGQSIINESIMKQCFFPLWKAVQGPG